MFDKISDSLKFFVFLTIYTIGIAYWAGELTANLNAQTTNLTQQSIVNSKTVELLNVHIKECGAKNIAHVRLEEDVKHLQHDVEYLLRIDRERNIFDGIKTKKR